MSEPPGEASARPVSRRLRVATTTAGLAAAASSAVFVAQRMADGWDQAGPALRSARPGWVLASLGCAAAAMVVVARAWVEVLRALGATIERRRGVACYFAGEIGKYLPGAVWPILGRAELARRAGVGPGVAYASVVASLGLWYLAASLVVALLAPWVVGDGGLAWAAGAAVALAASTAALHPWAGARVLALAARVLRGRPLGITVPSWRVAIALAARYLPAWAAIGAATWCVVLALGGAGAAARASVGRIVLAATLSWLVGFLAVPVPGGVGVREAVFVATCGLPAGLGAAVAVSARLAFVLVDAVGALLAGVSAVGGGKPDPSVEAARSRR